MTENTKKALVIIDLQNDYFPNGKFPLWDTDAALKNIKNAISVAKEKNIPIILVQHIANSKMGIAPFFNEGTEGAEIQKEIKEAASDAVIIVKEFADSFEQTNLEETLSSMEVEELLICGMMTQNCVTHTAISKKSEKFRVSVLADCCTTVDEMIHNIALHAMSTRVPLVMSNEAL